MNKLRAEQPGLIPLPALLFTRSVVVCEPADSVLRNTTRFDGSYLEDSQGRRGALRFQPRQQPRPHWLSQLLQA
ncbi:MAG: hypothetical protein ACRCYW_14350 [Aeromonas sp.]|uniref:hypothetical protein n=1 Tax=Aeromonas sp. TaxID=647 RepID=UPI003F3713DF